MAKKIDINDVLGVNLTSNKLRVRAVLHIGKKKRMYKYFTISKYGYEKALDLAIEARQNMEEYRRKYYEQ